MSSNIRITKKCQLCSSEFIAKTTVTKYCSDNCSKIAYKARKRAEKIGTVRNPVTKKEPEPTKAEKRELFFKDVLTVKETAQLLGFSNKTIYRLIEQGKLPAVNFGERLTRIKRTEVDKLFNQISK